MSFQMIRKGTVNESDSLHHNESHRIEMKPKPRELLGKHKEPPVT